MVDSIEQSETDREKSPPRLLYSELHFSPETTPLMQSIAIGREISLADLPATEFSFGREIDDYLRQLRDISLSQRKREFGVKIPLGVGENNKGLFYARRNLNTDAKGTFGQVRLLTPTQETLDRIQAEIHATAHTHPQNPPYHHFDDTWQLAYDSDRIRKEMLRGGSLDFEWIIAPQQASVIFATTEGRNYIQTHRPIHYAAIKNEMGEEVAKIAKDLHWPDNSDSLGMKSIAGRLLRSQWYGNAGFVIYTTDINASPVAYHRLDTSGTPRDFLKRLASQNLAGTLLTEKGNLT